MKIWYLNMLILKQFRNPSMMQFCDKLSQLMTGQKRWWQQRYILQLVQENIK